MRVPQKPPDWFSVFQKPGNVQLLIDKMTDETVVEFARRMNEKYVHWDKLRFKEMPKGLEKQLAWAVLKFTRRNFLQSLPLSFQNGTKLSYVLTPKHHEMLHDIDKQAGGDVTIGSEEFVDEDKRYLFNSLMEEAIASSQLEGASTTRQVAKEMLRTNRRPTNKAEQMIMNNYRAILEIRNLKKEKLTPELLCQLQEILTDRTLEKEDAAGRFRREDELVQVADERTGEILHVPPPAGELEGRIKEVCDFANVISDPFVHPVIKASVLHFILGYIHPFVDGNGRTARAIFYWYMLKRNYWLFEYFPISRVLIQSPAKYARAYLYTETDDGDVTYFIRFHLTAILTAIAGFRAWYANEMREIKEARELLESFPGLNNRQRHLIHDALKHTKTKYTTREHQGKYHVTYPTAHSDLLWLRDHGLLEESRLGRKTFFSVPHDLRRRLHLSPAKEGKMMKRKLPKSVAITILKEEQERAKTLFD
jgi:Fic family protein